MSKKPVETIEQQGIAIYEDPTVVNGVTYMSYRVCYYRAGKRIRERAKTLEIARGRAKELVKELAGLESGENPFTAIEARTINNAIDVLAPLDIGISDAARTVVEAEEILGGIGSIREAAHALVEQKAKKQLPSITFGELYTEFMETLMTEEVPGKIESRVYHRSFRYWQDSSQRLGGAAEIFRSTLITDINTRDLEKFLDKIPARARTAKGVVFTGKYNKATGRTRNNYRGALCTLFSFARKRGYLPRGVETEAEHILVAAENKSKKERAEGLQRRIYTPKEMQTILNELPEKWISFVVLGSFAGIRAAEIHRLEWRALNWEDHFITVESDQAKVGKRRIVRMSAQLEAWLKPLAKDSGWVCPHYSHDSTLNIEFAKVRKPIAVLMVENGHRHSYASYRLAEVKIPSEVAWEMNTSERKLKDNYLSLVNDRELSEWKQVLPNTHEVEKPKRRVRSLELTPAV